MAQGDSGYNAAAITPHASQMAGVIGRLRGQLQELALALLPLSAIILLNDPQMSAEAETVEAELLARYPGGAEASTLREQQRVPTALRLVLPPGLQGAFAAAMLGFFVSTHTTYMQAWGAILVQDVLIPIYGPQVREQHFCVQLPRFLERDRLPRQAQDTC